MSTDFTAPLPPRPPAVVRPWRYDLVRYGVTWEGQDNQPLLTPMPDGYWTPWHLAVDAPAGEPAPPCVWREEGPHIKPGCQRQPLPLWLRGEVITFRCCPYCLKPIAVE